MISIALHDDIQYAVINKLRTTAAVTALVSTRIYEEPPTNPTSPYVVLGDMRDDAMQNTMGTSTCSSSIATVYCPVHVVYQPDPDADAQKLYYKAARAVADAIETALHKTTLTFAASSWTPILCVQSGVNERRGDGGTRVIEQTYKVMAFK